MSSVREILTAIEKLPLEEFVKLQARMDRIAEQMWQSALNSFRITPTESRE